MTWRKESRREFLMCGVGDLGVMACDRVAGAQAGSAINDPTVVGGVRAAFDGYYRALTANDVSALNQFFWDSPHTVRYGNPEILYGHDEIASYRLGVTAPPTVPKQERAVITTFDKDFATTSNLNRRVAGKVAAPCRPGCAFRRDGGLLRLTRARWTSPQSDESPVVVLSEGAAMKLPVGNFFIWRQALLRWSPSRKIARTEQRTGPLRTNAFDRCHLIGGLMS
jgi:1-carboxybiuret hydrolase subunit AtzH-like protein